MFCGREAGEMLCGRGAGEVLRGRGAGEVLRGRGLGRCSVGGGWGDSGDRSQQKETINVYNLFWSCDHTQHVLYSTCYT